MAIYMRLRPGAGAKALGCLSALAAVGTAALYPLVLFVSGWALGSLDEAMAYPEEGRPGLEILSTLVVMTTVHSFILTTFCFGTVFSFIGTNQ